MYDIMKLRTKLAAEASNSPVFAAIMELLMKKNFKF